MAKKNNDEQVVENTEAPEVVTTDAADATGSASKRKKMTKEVVYDENPCVKISIVDGTAGEMVFPLSDLPEDIVKKLAPFGLGHKLGDAAAGTTGTDAEAAIQKVWEGLKKADWTVRAPAAPKLDKKSIMERLDGMDEGKQAAAKALLESLGFKF